MTLSPHAVHPSLDIVPDGRGVLIQAHLLADEPRHFEWRLTVDTQGVGGRSRIAQAGCTLALDEVTLAQVRVNNPGQAELEVFAEGRLVARAEQTFQIPTT